MRANNATASISSQHESRLRCVVMLLCIIKGRFSRCYGLVFLSQLVLEWPALTIDCRVNIASLRHYRAKANNLDYDRNNADKEDFREKFVFE